jgi:capsular exopolysaccharide synthesis family protein
MEALAYFRILRRRWKLVAACAVVAALAAFITTPAQPTGGVRTYVVDATLVRDGTNPSTPALSSLQLFMRTGTVPERVAARLGYEGNPSRLARSLTFTIDDAVGTLTVTAPGASPEEATDVANAFTAETILALTQQALEERSAATLELTSRVDQLQAQLADLDTRIRQLGDPRAPGATLLIAQQSAVQSQYGAAFSELQKLVTASTPTPGLRVLEPAEADLAVVSGGGFGAPRSRPVRTLIAAFVGLLLGVGIVLVIERVDPRLVTREAVEAVFALPVIASIPDEPGMRGHFEIFSQTEPASAVAEGFRSLRSALVLMPSHVLQHAPVPGSVAMQQPEPRDAEEEGEPEVVVVTSAAPGDGKSSTAANLAVTMAESGRSVLVLGYDFRKPSVHKYFGVGGQGLMDVLRDIDREGGLSLEDVAQATAIPGLSLVPHGTGEEGFGDVSANGREILNQARKLADVVIVDTPPLLVTNDAVELIPAADTTIIVCRSNKTTRDAAVRCRDLLERLGAAVSGVVLIGDPDPEASSYGDYYRYRNRARSSTVATKRRGLRRP